MRCKPGDLAEVVGGALGGRHNIGKIVNVIRLDGVHEEYGPIWYVMCDDDLITEYGGVTPDAHFADDWLRPIPKEAPKEKTDEKELEKV